MQVIIDFFKGIANVVNSIIDIVIGIFEDIVYVIKLLGQVLANIPSYFSWLPVEVVTILIIVVGIAAIYKLLGREG